MADAQTRNDVVQQLEQETRARGFVEYPKMLYHPDGGSMTVTDKKQETEALRGDWCPSPQDALDVKAERDEASAKRFQEQVAAEAEAKRKQDAEAAAAAAKAVAEAEAAKKK